MSSPHVSIIIPCRNEAAHIEQLLAALAGQDFKDFEIIIADGHSTDGTPALVKRYQQVQPDLSIRLIQNLSGTIPAGLNCGIQAAAGEVIVRLDGHSCPASDYVSRCVAALHHSGATVVGGAWNIQAGAPGVVAEAIAGAVSSRLGAGDAPYRLSSATQPCKVDTVPFGCFYRQTWERLGGYNETLLSNEDYEFNLRARLSGGWVYFDPRIRCDYFARASFSALAQQYARYGWWKVQMLKRHPGSLRLRQAVPFLWTSGSLLAGVMAGLIPSLRFATLLLGSIYFAVLLFGAGSVTLRSGKGVRFQFAVVVAYLVIHYSWGLGALWGLLPSHRHRPEKVFVAEY
jgi:succinoglycan biosynthesis protein ExoA